MLVGAIAAGRFTNGTRRAWASSRWVATLVGSKAAVMGFPRGFFRSLRGRRWAVTARLSRGLPGARAPSGWRARPDHAMNPGAKDPYDAPASQQDCCAAGGTGPRSKPGTAMTARLINGKRIT